MDLDDKQGTDSSSALPVDKTLDGPDRDTVIKDEPAPKAESAKSSDAPGDNDAPKLTSIVRDVVAAKKAPAAATASPADGSNHDPKPEKAPKEPDDADYTDVPFHRHPRFQHLLRKAKSHEQDATRYRNVETFLNNNGIGPEEAADALVVAGLLKTNPVEAWKRLKPIVQNLLVAAGELVPEDMAPRVQNGELSREAAIEIARARALAESTQRQMTFSQQQAQAREAQAQAAAIQNAAVTWEADRRAKDPNFDAKMKLLRAEVIDLQRAEGVPNTPEGVRVQLDRAYKAVVLPAAAPPPAPPQPKRPVPPGTTSNVSAAAEDTLSLIRATRARMRAAG
jgi:hypothetical protein